MRILALIPARGGSKRLPGKNKRLLGDRPLIVWSIDVARATSDVCDVLVSTDDAVIADLALVAGALVPWLRPPELATDSASSVDVALHALDWYENAKGSVDGVLLLQPTSPFRRRETIEQGIAAFCGGRRDAVVAVTAANPQNKESFRIDAGVLQPLIEGTDPAVRSQDPPGYEVSGAFYLISPADLRRHRTFLPAGTRPLVIESDVENIDIDSERDWILAEAALRSTKIQ